MGMLAGAKAEKRNSGKMGSLEPGRVMDSTTLRAFQSWYLMVGLEC